MRSAPAPLFFQPDAASGLLVAPHAEVGNVYLHDFQLAQLCSFLNHTPAQRAPSFALLTGPAKAGKSTTLISIVTGLQQMLGAAPVYVYVNAGCSSPQSFCTTLWYEIDNAGLRYGLAKYDVSGQRNLDTYEMLNLHICVDRLAQHLKSKGCELVLLLDDLEGPLARREWADQDKDRLAQILKCIVASPSLNTRVVATGSNMVTPLLRLSKVPTSDFDLFGRAFLINMNRQPDSEEKKIRP
jgi:hypothetical protein